MPKTKREPKQERMPLVQLHQRSNAYDECDYCDARAVWFHWADERGVNRDAYALYRKAHSEEHLP